MTIRRGKNPELSSASSRSLYNLLACMVAEGHNLQRSIEVHLSFFRPNQNLHTLTCSRNVSRTFCSDPLKKSAARSKLKYKPSEAVNGPPVPPTHPRPCPHRQQALVPTAFQGPSARKSLGGAFCKWRDQQTRKRTSCPNAQT